MIDQTAFIHPSAIVEEGAVIGANAVVTDDVPDGATMIGLKARSTLVKAETWAKEFMPYGTPCKEPCEPTGGIQRVEELEEQVARLRAQVEALLEDRQHAARENERW